MQLTIQQTAAYGQFQAVLRTADGREFVGWGLTRQQAEYQARYRANHSPALAGSHR